MRRVIEIVTAEQEGLDPSSKWYLIERDDHPEVKHPLAGNPPAQSGDCLGVDTKAQAISLRRQAYEEKIPLDAL